jgi:hypothetical protein
VPIGQAAPALTPASASASALAPTAIPITLPKLTAGAPQLYPSAGTASAPHVPPAGPFNTNVVQLRGTAGIEQASGLPPGVRDFLLLHARTLPAGQVPNYVVNLELADTWFRAHPEPDSVHQAATASHDSHTGCDVLSAHCAGEAFKHAADEARRQAQAEWDHLMGEVARDLKLPLECFNENTLSTAVPLKFSVTPGFPLTIGTDSANMHKAPTGADESGDVRLPVDVSFTAVLDVSYIPCLPFALRPTRIAADGALGVGARIAASVTANGQFSQTFAIPPGGGADFGYEIIPIRFGNTPIGWLDISIYLDGQVSIDGRAEHSSTLSAEISQQAQMRFSCSGSGCDLSVGGHTTPLTTAESNKLDGRIRVKPAILAALQISFSGDLLSARAGVEPYLQVTFDGCSGASATQNTAGASSSAVSDALLVDYDSGIEVLAEARVGPERIGSRSWSDDVHHIKLQDLAHSTALRPLVTGPTTTVASQPATYQVQMPGCYPYTDAIDYRIGSSGGAGTAAAVTTAAGTRPASAALPGSSAGCSLSSGATTCSADPRRELAVSASWPETGTYTLSAVPVHDAHGRDFAGVTATKLTVQVGAAKQQSKTAPASAAAPLALPVQAWALRPNLKLKGQMGSLVVAMPPGTGNTLVRVRPAGQSTTAFSGLGSQTHPLPPGSYDVSIGNATIPGVELRSGNDTEIQVGALKVAADNATTYEVFDTENRGVAKAYGRSITALPIGSYILRIAGQAQTITIEAGQVVEY